METTLLLMFIMVLVTTINLRRRQVSPSMTLAKLRNEYAIHRLLFWMMVFGGVLAFVTAFKRPDDLYPAGFTLFFCVMLVSGFRSYLGRLEDALHSGSHGQTTPSGPANNAS